MIDISLPLDWNLITYPGDARYEQYDYFTHEKNGVQITRIIMETHSGTHFDAPLHAIPNGRKSSEISMEKMVGPVTVVEVVGDSVKASDIPDTSSSRILFKTKNSSLYNTFSTDFCYITEEAAEKLVSKNVDLVGLDYLSIEKFGTKGMKIHKILLEKDTVILEGLNLSGVKPGNYELLCLPLKMNLDGAPCRAVLR
ncbi:MAG: cyclase family protein [Candidatus Thermoplasmatota archaeon]|nr:cyclase family protein [Candidatus Thermoplasmatota archaeon]MCL6090417.1 cyclase family protein [Candidatus Thermoplasmatota archaeon]MDA8142409.1 cyclase family protein [Thermoplasmatales archaeon]